MVDIIKIFKRRKRSIMQYAIGNGHIAAVMLCALFIDRMSHAFRVEDVFLKLIQSTTDDAFFNRS